MEVLVGDGKWICRARALPRHLRDAFFHNSSPSVRLPQIGKFSQFSQFTELGLAECVPCPSGAIAPEAGSVNCTICAEGSYDDGNNRCAKCAEGSYSARKGSASCEKCVRPWTTLHTGAVSCGKWLSGGGCTREVG